MKNTIGELMIKRKRNTLQDQQVLTMIDSIRKNLPRELMLQVDQMLIKANSTLAGQGSDLRTIKG